VSVEFVYTYQWLWWADSKKLLNTNKQGCEQGILIIWSGIYTSNASQNKFGGFCLVHIWCF